MYLIILLVTIIMMLSIILAGKMVRDELREIRKSFEIAAISLNKNLREIGLRLDKGDL